MAGELANERADDLPPGEAAALDAFFRAARAEGAEPSADFLTRILADAGEVAAARAEAAPSLPAPARRGGRWRRFSLLLGGWRGGAALTACALIGFMVGASGVADLSTDLRGFSTATTSASEAIGDFYDLAALE